MNSTQVWLGNKAWPSNQSCKAFAEDVFRLAGAKTDKEKAFAFFDWFTRCMMRGTVLCVPNRAGGYSQCFNSLLVLTGWGHGFCTYWGWISVECLNAAGLKARRIVTFDNGHTFYEVWYKGDDGIGQWHAFDPHLGWYLMNENGEVASCEQLGRNPQLVQNPLPGHSVPLGHHPDRAHLGLLQRVGKFLIIEQPLRTDENHWELQKGMEAIVHFIPEAPDKALFVKRDIEDSLAKSPNGAHCVIPEFSRAGGELHTKHNPYWRNYTWPTEEGDEVNEGRPVRWHGSGALRWTPLNYGADAACETHQAVFENGTVRPKGKDCFTEVWYRVKLPFLISWVQVEYDVAGYGDDYWGLSLSADDRQSLWPMEVKSHSPCYGVAISGQKQWKKGQSTVQGLREFWLRLDMFSHHDNPTLLVRGLRLSVGFQHNMHLQPRILPGENTLWLEAQTLDAGCRVEAEWIYQFDRKERREQLTLDSKGRCESRVCVDAPSPEDVKMTGIKLRCL
ncbi:MAG: hypothetical protein ABIH86_00825 [Planctomycetota bacterium]